MNILDPKSTKNPLALGLLKVLGYGICNQSGVEVDFKPDEREVCPTGFSQGMYDRKRGLPCRSAEGEYLNGWYS